MKIHVYTGYGPTESTNGDTPWPRYKGCVISLVCGNAEERGRHHPGSSQSAAKLAASWAKVVAYKLANTPSLRAHLSGPIHVLF